MNIQLNVSLNYRPRSLMIFTIDRCELNPPLKNKTENRRLPVLFHRAPVVRAEQREHSRVVDQAPQLGVLK